MVIMGKWDADEGLALAEQEHVTTLGGVPAIARQILEHPAAARLGGQVTACPMGGASVPPDLPLRAREVLGESLQILNGYGGTGPTSAVVTNVGDEYAARPGSVGRPNLTADLRVAGTDGQPLPVGEVGELCFRSPQVVKGYWNDPGATNDAFAGGWFRTGDLGYVDADGYVYVVDRLKDVVIRGGENVYCAEVEAVLFEHPAVADVAIIGLPDQAMGERVGAVVVARPGVSPRLEEAPGVRRASACRLQAPRGPLRGREHSQDAHRQDRQAAAAAVPGGLATRRGMTRPPGPRPRGSRCAGRWNRRTTGVPLAHRHPAPSAHRHPAPLPVSLLPESAPAAGSASL